LSIPPAGGFDFIGYDLVEEITQISALTNCGGFPDCFCNAELNRFGLLDRFDRATEIRRHLLEHHPKEPHANCELYAIWRLQADMTGKSPTDQELFTGLPVLVSPQPKGTTTDFPERHG
jgi:hypothetical protein